MSHYYLEDENVKDEPFSISFSIDGKPFTLTSNAGVFSKDRLDTGTEILLKTVLKEEAPAKTVLDLGCGIGVVGVVLGSFWKAEVTGIDTNARAAKLAEANYQKYGIQGEVLVQDGLQDLKEKYGCILLNPPIRTGKETIYRLFRESYNHLSDGGSLWIVIRKQHGAESAKTFLEGLAGKGNVKRAARDKGFWILRTIRKPEED